MDSGTASIKIEKLNENNFHIWKVKIRMILSIRELENHIDDTNSPAETEPGYAEWLRNDSKARAFIGLSLSDNHLEKVQHALTAKDMWTCICDIYEKHTLLNQLTARRRFYTASMKESDKVLDFSARVRLHAASLKSMGNEVTDQDMAMTFLSGLPNRFDVLISALDAMSVDEQKFTFDFVVGRCQQEEQRHVDRDQKSIAKSEAAALLARKGKSKGDCIHCGKHNDSSKCWKKFPHLAPEGQPYKTKYIALLSQQNLEDDSDDSEVVCLLGKTRGSASLTSTATKDEQWILDSGCSAHLCHNRTAFMTYSTVKHRPVDLGANHTTMIVGQGDIPLNINVGGQMKQCVIKNVQHVPGLKYQLLSVSCMAKNDINTEFNESGANLCRRSDGRVIATGSATDSGLYVLNMDSTNLITSEFSLLASLQTWNERMGHVNYAGILKMANNSVVDGLKISTTEYDECKGCIMGKGHRYPFPKARSSSTRNMLELVHSDVIGPMETKSLGGSRYILTFIDDYSKWTVVYPMRKKS